MLLQTGQLLSNIGTRLTSIAYPLLVLALTGSPPRPALSSSHARSRMRSSRCLRGSWPTAGTGSGSLIGADAVRVVAVSLLVAIIALDADAFWLISVIAFVEGTAAAFFIAAYPGAVRAVVPTRQLPDAFAVQTGRNAVVQLAGSPLGGALFTIARVLPFVVDVISYAFSAISLLMMRASFQEKRERDASSLRAQLLEGVRYVWRQPFLRTVALIFGLLNFVGPSVLFAIVVIGTDQGLSGGQVGLLVAVFFAGILPGTLLSPYIRRALPVRAVFVLELWTWVGCAAFLVWPSVYVLAVCLLPTALVIPSTDSVVHGYRIAMTPDRLLGRAESAWTTFAIVISPIGPLVTGVLITEVSARAAIGLCVALALFLALWATLSPAIRNAPTIDDLEEIPATPSPEAL